MIVFLTGCILFKTDLSVNLSPTAETSIQIQQNMLLYAKAGPSVSMELRPKSQRLALGASSNISAIEALFDMDWAPDCTVCQQSMLMSTVGVQTLALQHRDDQINIAFLSPFVQLHIPLYCPLANVPLTNNQKPCASLFLSAEHQNLGSAPNRNVFGIGVSYAFLESAW